jgi:hypothetical protein
VVLISDTGKIMGCCGNDKQAVELDYDPAETYRFEAKVKRRVLENGAIAVAAGVALAVFLTLVVKDGKPVVETWLAALLGIGAFVFCFVGTSIHYLGRARALWVEVSPHGVRYERRDGQRFDCEFKDIKGYVFNGLRLTFVNDEGGAFVDLIGLTPGEVKLLLKAVRTPMSQGSMKWRSDPNEKRARGGRMPLIVTVVLIGVAILLKKDGQDALAVGVFVAMVLYNIYAFMTRPKPGA